MHQKLEKRTINDLCQQHLLYAVSPGRYVYSSSMAIIVKQCLPPQSVETGLITCLGGCGCADRGCRHTNIRIDLCTIWHYHFRRFSPATTIAANAIPSYAPATTPYDVMLMNGLLFFYHIAQIADSITTRPNGFCFDDYRYWMW